MYIPDEPELVNAPTTSEFPSPYTTSHTSLQGNIDLLPGWVQQCHSDGGTKLCKLVHFDDRPPAISHSIIISKELTWNAYVRHIAVHDFITDQSQSNVTSGTISILTVFILVLEITTSDSSN